MKISAVVVLSMAARCAAALQPSRLHPSTPRAPAPRASLLTSVSAGLVAASGALAWAAPAHGLSTCGLAASDLSALSTMRTVGCWQLCSAAVMLAGRGGASHASGFGLLAASLATLANVANWDVLDRPLSNQLPGVLVMALLGKLTLDGAVGARWGAGVYLLLGGLIYLDPRTTISTVYAITKPVSAAGYSLLAASGATIVATGVYLVGLAYGLSQPQSLAALLLTNSAVALKWVLAEAGGLGASKLGALGWAAVSALLSALAFK